MKEHFSDLPAFLYAVAHKVTLYVGVGAGIIFVIFAYLTSMDTRTITTLTVAIIGLSLLLAAYGVYHEERAMRSKLEERVRIAARVSRQVKNIPDPGKDKESLEVHLVWDMWAREETATDQLALNLIYVYEKHWWQFWEKAKSPKFGMSRNGQESIQYRRIIGISAAQQPDRDEGVFKWAGDKKTLRGVRGFELELVLVTGMPPGRYSVPVAIDWKEIRSRGSNPPL